MERNRLLHSMDAVLDMALAFLMSVVVLTVFVQVLLRYVLQAPMMGIEEMLLFPVTWLYMLGAVRASSEKTQIVARVVEIFLRKKRAIYLLRAAASVLSCFVLMWLTYWGYDYLQYILRVWKESPTLYIPTFWYESSVFSAFLLITFYTLVELYEYACLYSKTEGE